MVEESAVINNEKGIHVRPSGLIYQAIAGYNGTITIDRNGMKTVLTDIISILTLGLAKDTKIKIIVEGSDEEEMAQKVKELFEKCYKFAEQ